MIITYIGSTPNGNLCDRLWERVTDPLEKFDPATKAAWVGQLPIWVSWVVAPDRTRAKEWEARLLHEWKRSHGNLPGLHIEGRRIRGNAKGGTPSKDASIAMDNLNWSNPVPLYDWKYRKNPQGIQEQLSLFDGVPKEPGIYRMGIRAVSG